MSKPPDNPAEFDSYAENYAALIRDPLRLTFTASDRFFAERKIQVIQSFFESRGIDSHRLAWLDVGCGQGDLLRLGKPHFASVTGTDPSSAMLAACAGLDVRQQTTPLQVPFDDRKFDFVTAVCVYHHVPEAERPAFTREILRVLKPGGMLCVIEHNPVNPVTKLIVSRSPVDVDAHLLTAWKTRKLLSVEGCEIVDTRYFLFLPQRIHKYVARLENLLTAVPLGGQYCVMSLIR